MVYLLDSRLSQAEYVKQTTGNLAALAMAVNLGGDC